MQKINSDSTGKNLNNVIKINEAQIQNHLGQMVRSTVKQTPKTGFFRDDYLKGFGVTI